MKVIYTKLCFLSIVMLILAGCKEEEPKPEEINFELDG
jgi:hypothetical protein